MNGIFLYLKESRAIRQAIRSTMKEKRLNITKKLDYKHIIENIAIKQSSKKLLS